MLDAQDLADIHVAWRARYAERSDRHDKIDDIVGGDWKLNDPNGDQVNAASPNFIQVGIEDTAEASSLVPTVRVQPHRNIASVKKSARLMEKIATQYFATSEIDLLLPRTVMSLQKYGLAPWVVRPDAKLGLPVIELRDARTCYPEPGMSVSSNTHRVLFSREVFLSQMPGPYREALMAEHLNLAREWTGWWKDNIRVTLIEFFDDDEYVLAGVPSSMGSYGYEGARGGNPSATKPTILERIPNRIGACPVIVNARITDDGEHRGQWDQAIKMQLGHARLQGLAMDYADQSVYSDMYASDVIGEVSIGGGSIIQLGPQGKIGRVPPAVSSLTVFQDLDRLEEGMHLAGRWPASRPGEVSQSIASARFLEAAAGMMNTVIKTYHLILQRGLQKALPIAFAVDKAHFPGEKQMTGILRNQEFLEPYHTDFIDTENRVRVEYGLGLGRTPEQAAVLMIQYQGSGMVSKQFVQENIDGVQDVSRERARIDVQDFTDMMKGKILQGVQEGRVPERALLEMAKAREQGEDLWELYEKYVVQPVEEQVAGGVPSGLNPGTLAGSGAPIPGGGPGGAVPAAPETSTLNRLAAGIPGLGSRTVVGSDVRTGAGQ